MTIRTPDYHLRVFVSSTLKELAEERKAVHQAIKKLRLAPVMFESGARPHPAQELYKSYLSQSQIFIGIYWQSYGWVAPGTEISGLEDEYNLSAKLPRLIYIKNPAPDRQAALTGLLERIRNDNTSCYTNFSTPAQLKELVQNDLVLLLSERFEGTNLPQHPGIEPKIHLSTNLPIPRNPLIDRKTELKNTCDQLRRDDIALITLTGPGGTGKSRLAIQAGLDLLDFFPGGVYLVRLESISDPNLVIPTIAETFNLRESQDSRPIVEMVNEFLQDKRMLLILDNFEQVVEAAPYVANLLEACPQLKCVVTSRTPLRLRAERELPVPPLKTPSLQQLTALDSLSQYAAVELFIQRAQAVRPDFTITDANAPAVAEICHRLDGLPLAIELAAARIKLLTPHGLLSRLEHRFDLLTGGTRDLPERQRTLRGAIDWSFNLLNDTEKKLFRRLSVFVGGYTLDAAAVVCNFNDDLDRQLEDAMTSLIDNNLVTQLQEYEDEPRFGMLSTIQEYARERLTESDEDEVIHKQHAQFFLDFVSLVEPRIRSAERVHWYQVMQQEFGNIRATLEWVSTSGKCIDIGQQIVIRLGLFWQICGHLAEGQQWCQKMLALSDEATPITLRAGLLCYEGLLIRSQNDQIGAMETINKSLELCRQQDDQYILGNALLIRGMIASAMRDLETASSMFQEAIDTFRSTNHQWNEVIALSWLGDVALFQNDQERAKCLHAESIRLGRQQGDPWCLMPALISSAQVDIINGEYDLAYPKLEEIIEVLYKTDDRWSLSWTLIDLGHVVYMQGDLDRAGAYFLEGMSLANTFGNIRALIIALAEVAAIIASRTQAGDPQMTLAALLCGSTAASIDSPGIFIWINTRKLYEDAVSHVQSLMEADQWDKSFSEGKNLPLEKAIKLAMQALNKIG